MGRKKYTVYKFVELAKRANGGRYDYSKSNYIDMHTKVLVICEKHGEFPVLPFLHINKKSGCPKCSLIEAAKSRSIGFDKFVNRSNIIHDNKFKYVKNSYINTQKKVIIVCPVHGRFQQTASSHLTGFGCKKCTFEKL